MKLAILRILDWIAKKLGYMLIPAPWSDGEIHVYMKEWGWKIDPK